MLKKIWENYMLQKGRTSACQKLWVWLRTVSLILVVLKLGMLSVLPMEDRKEN